MMAHWRSRFGQFGATAIALILGILMLAPAALASVSQAYVTTTTITVGSLVSLDAKVVGNVVVADVNTQDRLFGVVVTPSTTILSLGASATGQVQVATSGAANALVSTTSGDIKVGDPIAVSVIAGVGQKAVGQVRIIGTAQADLNAGTAGVTKRTIQDAAGANHEVVIGQIPVLIAVNTNHAQGDQNSVIPTWIQDVSNSLAGKVVSPVRIIIAGLILVVSLISVAVLLYSAVRNAIISIGRNPLSRVSVLKSLLEVVVVAVIILAVAIGAMYLVISR